MLKVCADYIYSHIQFHKPKWNMFSALLSNLAHNAVISAIDPLTILKMHLFSGIFIDNRKLFDLLQRLVHYLAISSARWVTLRLKFLFWVIHSSTSTVGTNSIALHRVKLIALFQEKIKLFHSRKLLWQYSLFFTSETTLAISHHLFEFGNSYAFPIGIMIVCRKTII